MGVSFSKDVENQDKFELKFVTSIEHIWKYFGWKKNERQLLKSVQECVRVLQQKWANILNDLIVKSSCTYSSLSSLRILIKCNTYAGFIADISPLSITFLQGWLARISVITVQFDIRCFRLQSYASANLLSLFSFRHILAMFQSDNILSKKNYEGTQSVSVQFCHGF